MDKNKCWDCSRADPLRQGKKVLTSAVRRVRSFHLKEADARRRRTFSSFFLFHHIRIRRYRILEVPWPIHRSGWNRSSAHTNSATSSVPEALPVSGGPGTDVLASGT